MFTARDCVGLSYNPTHGPMSASLSINPRERERESLLIEYQSTFKSNLAIYFSHTYSVFFKPSFQTGFLYLFFLKVGLPLGLYSGFTTRRQYLVDI